MTRNPRFMTVLFLTMLLASTAYAVDVAIYTQANWWSQDAADREMGALRDAIEGYVSSVELFTVDDQDVLADWVKTHTNSRDNIFVMCGRFPSIIYPANNSQRDGSIAEDFLDAGNTILNTGDYMFFVSGPAEVYINVGGLQNMTDVPGAFMWPVGNEFTGDRIDMTVTPEGETHTPSLVAFASNRPIQVENYEGTPWELEIALAGNTTKVATGHRVDPGVLMNTETGGRIGIFYQLYENNDMPRAAVMSEYILNYYLQNIAAVDSRGKLPAIWGQLRSQ